jgi:PAS domain S-box-containing protein
METAAQADILGRLLVIQQAIQVLPNEASIAAFLGRALDDAPGVGKVSVCLRGVLYPPDGALADACRRFLAVSNAPASIGQKELGAIPGTELIPFATVRHLYGFLALDLEDAAAFAPYASFIKNIAGVVAVYLEARNNFAEIARAKSELELSVAERTAEVREQNAQLLAEIAQRKEAERSARMSAIEIEDLYNNAPCGYHSADKEGLIIRINDTELAWLGYAREEVVGKKTIFDLWSPATKVAFAKAFLRLKMRGWIIGEEFEMIRRNGTVFPVLLAATAVTDRDGNFVMSRGVVHDITDRKRVEERNQRLAAIVESSDDAIFGKTLEGVITSWNEGAERIYGYTPEEAIGKPVSILMPPGREEEMARNLALIREGRHISHFETPRRRKDGTEIYLSLTLSPVKDAAGNIIGVSAIERDVTELRRTEEELRQQHKHLEELVAARTAELSKANEGLESANKELEAFAYSVSHDLRVPLRAIDGFSRILLEDYSATLDAEGQRVLNVVRDSTVKMARLIDDILAFSRAGRGEMILTRIDMDELVHVVLGELEPVLAGRKLTFDIKPLASAQGDTAMIQRVWTNLIDNAVKFTAPKPDAVIEIGSTAGQEETIYYVKDNGAGFDMQYANKLFGVFQRLHGGEFAGTGIGLAIVKRIVARHGGRVWAEGKVNEGATFYFTLPVRENSHA